MSSGGILDRWKALFVAELKADKRKVVVLVVLAALAAVLLTRLLVKSVTPSKAAPAAAMAAMTMSENVAAKDEETTPPAHSGVDEARLTEYLSKVDRKISRDLFVMNLDLFTRVTPIEATVKPIPKITTTRPTGPSPAELLRQRVQIEATALELQSTIVGGSPTAIINGRILQKGSQINGFRIAEITDRSCVVEKEGVRLTLLMNRE